MLSSTQAGPGRKVKQQQEEISRNHVPRLLADPCMYFTLGVCTKIVRDRIAFANPLSRMLSITAAIVCGARILSGAVLYESSSVDVFQIWKLAVDCFVATVPRSLSLFILGSPSLLPF